MSSEVLGHFEFLEHLGDIVKSANFSLSAVRIG